MQDTDDWYLKDISVNFSALFPFNSEVIENCRFLDLDANLRLNLKTAQRSIANIWFKFIRAFCKTTFELLLAKSLLFLYDRASDEYKNKYEIANVLNLKFKGIWKGGNKDEWFCQFANVLHEEEWKGVREEE